MPRRARRCTTSPGTSSAASTSKWSRSGCRTTRSARDGSTRALAHTLDTLLRLLHPVMPFITEEIWQLLGQIAPAAGTARVPSAAPDCLMRGSWPVADATRQQPEIEQQFARFQATLGALREIRSRQGIAPKERLEFSIRCDTAAARLLRRWHRTLPQWPNAHGRGWGPEISAAFDERECIPRRAWRYSSTSGITSMSRRKSSATKNSGKNRANDRRQGNEVGKREFCQACRRETSSIGKQPGWRTSRNSCGPCRPRSITCAAWISHFCPSPVFCRQAPFRIRAAANRL